MYETPADRSELQELLDRSIATSGTHLRSIVEPDTHTLTADQVVRVLTGMTTLALATVTAAGEPRVSAVDGHLLRGRFVFTTTTAAVKARHLRRRPAVSAAHLVGDDFGVFVHGHARFLDVDTPAEAWVENQLVAHYGSSPRTWAGRRVPAHRADLDGRLRPRPGRAPRGPDLPRRRYVITV